SPIDQRLACTLDRLALDSAPEFDALLLSPVTPLGTGSVVAPTSQDRAVSTIRSTEVVSDPTNVLALESAKRLADGAAEVRLATVHQTLRAQPVAGADGIRTQHFRLLALSEAGRGLPDDGFEVRAVVRQLAVFDRVFDACEAELGVELPHRRAVVRVGSRAEPLAARVSTALSERLPHVQLETEALDSTYYHGLRVGFGARDRSGAFVEIADLGRFDWVARLVGDRRLRFVSSGLGMQLLPFLF
ncbi:MAG: hypothetical protein ACRDT9_16240, partial [Agromyces sp.]